MALEQSGISLEAEGFSQYIKRLDEINKKQKEVFDTEFKGTGKTFSEVTRLARQYQKELDDTAKAEQRAAKAAEKAARDRIKAQKKAQQEAKKLAEIQKAAVAAQRQAFISAGTAALDFAQKIGQVVVDSGKLAAQFEGQRTGLDNLAAAAGQSGAEIQSAIQSAAKGTVSGLDAITAANQGLLFGVAKTPEQFAELTRISTILGRTLGLDATRSIEEFTLALGRGSKEILDNFGVSAKQVNAEIERIAQADFGKANAQLSEAQKQAVFLQAALKIAGEAANIIGDEAGEAQASFDRLSAASENLQITFGALVQPVGVGLTGALTKAAKTAQQLFAIIGAGAAGSGKIITGLAAEFGTAFSRLGQLIKGEISFAEFNQPLREFSDIIDEASIVATDRFKEIASTIEGVSFPNDEARQFAQNIKAQGDAAQEAAVNIEAYQSVLQQAESLQLSFARSAEDSALRLSRANEDIARKQGQQVAKLQQQQAKDRDRLLKNQVSRLDEFEKSRRDQISKAESDISKARKEANEQRKRDQEKLQRELRQAEEKFNLSQLQASRRFDVQSRRLRAEGDILALQQLREDRELEQQEEKENFSLSRKERKQSGEEQQREQAKDLERQLSELKTNLEDQRAELLASFDQQLATQQETQQEMQIAQRQSFIDQAAERTIQLQREEEDRRISQARQLEDLGRSFAEQEGVTIEGTSAIANQLEKVFGINGTADSVITGFTSKTKSEFTNLFADIEKIVKDAEAAIGTEPVRISRPTGAGGFGGRIGGMQEFNDGGVVNGPGPVGSPIPVMAHVGETFLPTHQQSFTMSAPAIPSQNLNVNMSGGFDITGGEVAGEAATRQAITEMTDAFEIVVKRLGRQV